MNKGILIILIGCCLILSCNKENEIGEEIEAAIIATGILNGEEWMASKTSFEHSDEIFSFGLMQEKDKIGCPHHHLLFENIPLKIGSYQLNSTFSNEPIENIVYSRLSYTCGDAILAFYKIEENLETYITITSISENVIIGEFSANFILTDNFQDVPENFDFLNINFQFEL